MDFAASVVAIIEAMRRFACRLALPHLRTGLIAFEPSLRPNIENWRLGTASETAWRLR
jgi:hypothetical protein